MWKRTWLALAIVAALILGAVGASAQVDGDSAGDPSPAATVPEAAGTETDGTDGEAPAASDETLEKDDCDFDEFLEEWKTEEVDEINAETDALVEYLTRLGFEVTVETDELGVRFPVFDDDEALDAAIEEFFEAQFAAEVAGWTDAEKAEHNAWVDELVAKLEAEGITVETTEIAPGVRDIAWTEDIEAALDDLYEMEDPWFGDGWFHEFGEELPDEVVDEINAETDALVEYLTGLGFEVTVETDELGVRFPVFDDDEALDAAIEEFFGAQFAAEVAGWTDAEKAEHNAWVDELVAKLEAEGITVETTEIAPGVRDIAWTEDIEAALDDLYEKEDPWGFWEDDIDHFYEKEDPWGFWEDDIAIEFGKVGFVDAKTGGANI